MTDVDVGSYDSGRPDTPETDDSGVNRNTLFKH